jgi:hypothetical protein
MTHSQRGSATIHTLLAAVLLITALAAATLWSTISTARHKLTTAADLTALSAAQTLATTVATTADQPTNDTPLGVASAATTNLVPSTDAKPTTAYMPTSDTTRSPDSAPRTDFVEPDPSLITQRLRSTYSTADHPLTHTAPAAAPVVARAVAPAAEPAAAPAAAGATPCETAARVATLNKVHLTNCKVTTDAVTVEVSLQLDLPLGRPTLSATARAGPL